MGKIELIKQIQEIINKGWTSDGKATLAAANKLAKWRMVYASRWLGTRLSNDPEAKAIRDFAEARLLMRAEINALTFILLGQDIATQEEIDSALYAHYVLLDKELEETFPGWESSDHGMVITDIAKANSYMKDWPA